MNNSCVAKSNILKPILFPTPNNNEFNIYFEEIKVRNKSIINYFYENPNMYLTIEIPDLKVPFKAEVISD